VARGQKKRKLSARVAARRGVPQSWETQPELIARSEKDRWRGFEDVPDRKRYSNPSGLSLKDDVLRRSKPSPGDQAEAFSKFRADFCPQIL
jgi:hypothetical protein